MTVNTVEVTGSSNFPYQDNRCPGGLWSGCPELAESPKIIDDQMASMFFRQEFPEYRTAHPKPASQHLQEKLVGQHFQVTEPWDRIPGISVFARESQGPFQVIIAAEGTWRAGPLQQSPERREARQPVKPVNGSEGWGRAREPAERYPHLRCS